MKTTTMNQEQQDFCKIHNLTEDQFFGREIINRSLYLNGLESIPEGFNPTVGWDLYLNGLESIPIGFNPIVGCGLSLDSLKSIPEGFNPTVGGNLFLNSLKSIPEGFNPTVGGYLSLIGLKSIPEWFNPIVGGVIYYNKYNTFKTIKSPQSELNWQGEKYIKRDGIFSEVISHKGNIYKVKNIGCNLEDKITYLITDGKGNFAHGETLSEAKSDLIFKTCKRNKDNYKGLTLESALTYEDMIVCYRVITGACSQGTKMFCNSELGDKPKESYSISEVIKLTDGQYGNKDFKGFFKS